MENDDCQVREKAVIILKCLFQRHLLYLVLLKANVITSSPFIASIITAKIIKRAISGAKTEMECQGEDVLNVKRGASAADRPIISIPKKTPIPFFKYFWVLNLFHK